MDKLADNSTCMTQLCKESSLLKHFLTTPRQRNQCRGEGFLAVGMPNEQWRKKKNLRDEEHGVEGEIVHLMDIFGINEKVITLG